MSSRCRRAGTEVDLGLRGIVGFDALVVEVLEGCFLMLVLLVRFLGPFLTLLTAAGGRGALFLSEAVVVVVAVAVGRVV